MGFLWFRRISTVALCGLLLFLFVVPQRFLDRRSAQWNAQIDTAAAALRREDFASAAQECAALVTSYRASKDALERFLHHDAVDAVLADLWEAQALSESRDAPGALAALARAQGDLAHMLCIETFTLNALL